MVNNNFENSKNSELQTLLDLVNIGHLLNTYLQVHVYTDVCTDKLYIQNCYVFFRVVSKTREVRNSPA